MAAGTDEILTIYAESEEQLFYDFRLIVPRLNLYTCRGQMKMMTVTVEQSLSILVRRGYIIRNLFQCATAERLTGSRQMLTCAPVHGDSGCHFWFHEKAITSAEICSRVGLEVQ